MSAATTTTSYFDVGVQPMLERLVPLNDVDINQLSGYDAEIIKRVTGDARNTQMLLLGAEPKDKDADNDAGRYIDVLEHALVLFDARAKRAGSLNYPRTLLIGPRAGFKRIESLTGIATYGLGDTMHLDIEGRKLSTLDQIVVVSVEIRGTKNITPVRTMIHVIKLNHNLMDSLVFSSFKLSPTNAETLTLEIHASNHRLEKNKLTNQAKLQTILKTVAKSPDWEVPDVLAGVDPVQVNGEAHLYTEQDGKFTNELLSFLETVTRGGDNPDQELSDMWKESKLSRRVSEVVRVLKIGLVPTTASDSENPKPPPRFGVLSREQNLKLLQAPDKFFSARVGANDVERYAHLFEGPALIELDFGNMSSGSYDDDFSFSGSDDDSDEFACSATPPDGY